MRKTVLVQAGVLALLCSCLWSCKLGNDDKDVIVKVDPEIQIGMHEKLDAIRSFQLTFTTIEAQACSTNTFNYNSGRVGRNMSLDLFGIQEVSNCQTGPGQVTGQTSFDFLPNGRYNLTLNLKNTVMATAQLDVSDEKYQLDLEEGLGFAAAQTTLYRVPQSMVWGYIGYKDAQYADEAQQFLNEAKTRLETVNLAKGDYSYFALDGYGKLNLANAPDYGNVTTFYGKLASDEANLRALLENYRSQYPNGEMEFKVFTWLGETL